MEGMHNEAVQILCIMEESGYRPDTDNFNALMLGLCKSQRTDMSLEIFQMMIEKNFKPNETTYTILVEGIVHEGEKDLAIMVLKELHAKQVISLSTLERLVMQYDLETLLV